MRECGILLPVASLPSRYGIGAFSREAYDFIDDLKEAGQNYWQILPLGPTGYGDSPYQSFSAFAGNPYFIDPEQLIGDGLLTAEECDGACFGQGSRYVDYGAVYAGRFPVLKKAYIRWKERTEAAGEDVDAVLTKDLCEETKEYCLYAAVKRSFGEKSWDEWDEDIRLREPEALGRLRKELKEEIRFYEFQQMMFGKQWKALKEYAHSRGIRIIGDIPIYVAFDSADSWFHPELFQFDERLRPTAVAGVPPDAFSDTGQLWGNPLYRWDYHEKTGFAWWMRRLRYCFDLYDVVRIDHFRGFEKYYAVPAGAESAVKGKWEKGPGFAFFEKMKEVFGSPDIIAEDLGLLTPEVLELVERTGFPGMKVLQFAFDSGEKNPYLPCYYPKNCVVYTGTHDNDTLRGWYDTVSPSVRRFAAEYMHNGNTPWDEMHWDFIRLAVSSAADLCVIPMQDYLGLGWEARINTPSTLGGNWEWRMKKGEFTPELKRRCREINRLYGRVGARGPEKREDKGKKECENPAPEREANGAVAGAKTAGANVTGSQTGGVNIAGPQTGGTWQPVSVSREEALS